MRGFVLYVEVFAHELFFLVLSEGEIGWPVW